MSRNRALLISAPILILAVLLAAGIGAARVLTRFSVYPGSRFVSNSGLLFQADSKCVPCQLGDVSLGTASLFETSDSNVQIEQWSRRNGWNVMDSDPVFADWTFCEIAGHRITARAWVRNLYHGQLEVSYGLLLWW